MTTGDIKPRRSNNLTMVDNMFRLVITGNDDKLGMNWKVSFAES